MVADSPASDPARESVLEAIARQAAGAPRKELVLLLLLAALGVLAALVTRGHGPVLAAGGGALAGATGSLALWELCRRSEVASASARRTAQRMLAALGVALWFAGGMALLLALLGDPWQL